MITAINSEVLLVQKMFAGHLDQQFRAARDLLMPKLLSGEVAV